ncbi:MAG: riboflavin biosynthesis protein RibF [Kiritimatiellia bacterium]|jgi:riboflavin kinase/FMN adenylyltransferase
MQVLTHIRAFRRLPGPIVLAAGFFDGVHRGHARVLQAAVDEAREMGAEAWVLTFDRHPMALLAPERKPPLLTSPERKLELLEEFGFDGCLVLPFTRALAAQSPRRFIASLAGAAQSAPDAPARIAALHCGANWTFGAQAAGTWPVLRELGREFGFRARKSRPVLRGGQPVSSTRIRNAVATGDLALAARMLGRAPSVEGVVRPGRAVGRTLGRPTANLAPRPSIVLPPDGVYAVEVRTGKNGAPLRGVANLGPRPTFHDAASARRTLEIHLLDFDGDLYGETLEVSFLRFLRTIRAFDTPAALAAQIAKDVARTRNPML